MEKDLKDDILLVKMYTGSYGEKENQLLKHEIINNFRCDDGNEYIYIPYDGISANKNIKSILFVSSINDGQFRVLAKAEGLTKIENGNAQYVIKNDIKYGGVHLHKIFGLNDTSKNIIITYKVDKIVKIKKEKMVFVSNNMSEKEINKDYIVYPVNDLKWRQKMYNLNENYNIFRDIIDNVDNIWEENDEVDIVPVEKYQDITQSKNLNFLQFIKKEDDETIYTNMLWYWFSRKSMLDKFIKNYLNENDNYILDREKVTGNQGRMDIFAEGENNIIIIENKIKSGLNGINKENNTSQLNKYFEDAFKKASEKSKKDNKKIKKITGFIFVPNYNEERIKSEISEYKKVNFKIITYKELYNFFKENEKEINGDVYYKYYSDFLNALNNQTYSTINEMEKIETEKKFIFAIKNA